MACDILSGTPITTIEIEPENESLLMKMQHTHSALQLYHMLPYGAVVHDSGVQFVVFSRNATEMRLLLYDDVRDTEPDEIIRFDSKDDRWGDIWSIFVPGIGPGQLYHFQAGGPYDPARGMRFDSSARLIDPYARALVGEFQLASDGIVRPPKCVVIDDYFDWAGDRHLRRDVSETVIYEVHVRGFTRHPSSKVEHPGTYLGFIEKIPYLKSLGVTAVELMPVHEFPTNEFDGRPWVRGNYWGYDPLALFAPTAVTPQAANRVLKSPSSNRWLRRCTPRASKSYWTSCSTTLAKAITTVPRSASRASRTACTTCWSRTSATTGTFRVAGTRSTAITQSFAK